MILRVLRESKTDLLLIVETGNRLRLYFCAVQGGQQHSGEDCNDGNRYEELHKSEVSGFAFKSQTVSAARISFHDMPPFVCFLFRV